MTMTAADEMILARKDANQKILAKIHEIDAKMMTELSQLSELNP